MMDSPSRSLQRRERTPPTAIECAANGDFFQFYRAKYPRTRRPYGRGGGLRLMLNVLKSDDVRLFVAVKRQLAHRAVVLHHDHPRRHRRPGGGAEGGVEGNEVAVAHRLDRVDAAR